MLIGTTTMAIHDIDCYRARGLSDFGNKDMIVHMHVPLLPWSTAQHFISQHPPVRTARQTLLDAIHMSEELSPLEQASRSHLPKSEQQQVARLITHMTMVQEVVLDEIQTQLQNLQDLGFDTLPDADDDNIGGFAPTHSLSPDETGKPKRFPSAIWQHVADHERPHVIERWSKFDEERLTEVLTELAKADIEPSRPNQRPYWTAHVYANADAFFHADEDNPPLINGFEFRIITDGSKKAVGHRNNRWDLLEQKYLKVKEESLLRTSKCKISTSEYRSPIRLVQYAERVKDFPENYGDEAYTKIDDPAYANIVGKFYRLTIDMRLLNAITKKDEGGLPLIADCIDRFHGNRYFSHHDVQDAFWAVSLAPCDRHNSAFQTLNHLLEWQAIPQGCKNGATMFARIAAHYFSNLPDDIDKS